MRRSSLVYAPPVSAKLAVEQLSLCLPSFHVPPTAACGSCVCSSSLGGSVGSKLMHLTIYRFSRERRIMARQFQPCARPTVSIWVSFERLENDFQFLRAGTALKWPPGAGCPLKRQHLIFKLWSTQAPIHVSHTFTLIGYSCPGMHTLYPRATEEKITCVIHNRLCFTIQ